MKLVPIAKGVNGLFIQNNRFSTTHISVNLYLPLKRETVAVNALLPFVLSSCSAEYPDFSALNLRLNELYGADVGGIADKIGDTQVLRFFSYFIDDEYIPNGDKVADEAVELLISMLFKPSVKNGSFLKAAVERCIRMNPLVSLKQVAQRMLQPLRVKAFLMPLKGFYPQQRLEFR